MKTTCSPGAAAAGLVLAALLAGCADVPLARMAVPASLPLQAQIGPLPDFTNPTLHGAAATLTTVLAHSGVAVAEEAIAAQLEAVAWRGGLQREMLAAARRHGRVGLRLAPRLGDLLQEIAAGSPVVVLRDVGTLTTQLQFAVLTGYDTTAHTVSIGGGLARERLSFAAFERAWQPGGSWAMVAVPPNRVAASASEGRWLEAVDSLAAGGDVEAATQAAAAALQRWPDSVGVAIGLAHQLHARGDLAQAATVLGTLRERNPQSVIVVNNLAQTLSELGRHAEALRVLEQAQDPRSPFASDVRATRILIEQRLRLQRAGR